MRPKLDEASATISLATIVLVTISVATVSLAPPAFPGRLHGVPREEAKRRPIWDREGHVPRGEVASNVEEGAETDTQLLVGSIEPRHAMQQAHALRPPRAHQAQE